MQYIVCGKTYVGAELISEELESHHEPKLEWWDCSCMNPKTTPTNKNSIYFFENPNCLINYVNAHPEEIFHVVYIQSTDELSRKMRASKHGLELNSEEMSKYFEEEKELFKEFEYAITHLKENLLPENISAVLIYQMDFTPPCVTNIASNMTALRIAFDNTKHILKRAIECEILSVDEEGNILSPTEDDPSHRINPDICCDMLMSDNQQLGEMVSRLLYDENLFKD